MNDAHQGPGHRGRLWVLDYVAAIDDSLRALLHQLDGALDNFSIRSPPAASDQNTRRYWQCTLREPPVGWEEEKD